MNVAELQSRLTAEGIHPNHYSLFGGDRENTFSIERARDGWHVYYAERGTRWDDQIFSDEEEACNYFLETLLKDPTTRVP